MACILWKYHIFAKKRNMNQNTAKILLVIVILEAAAIAWLVYDRMQMQSETVVLTQNITEVTDERDEVQKELKEMYEQYESMKSDNSKMNAELEAQQEMITKLMDELKRTKRGNRNRIKQLEEETETLRDIMKSYIRQIDSLNTQNKQLVAENEEVREKYKEELTEKEDVLSERDSLSATIEVAKKLTAYNMKITPLNRRGRSTKRARKMKRLKVCFTLSENPVAAKGAKRIYMRIADPSKQIVLGDGSGFFMFKGKEIAFSADMKVNYQGKMLNDCMYWTALKEHPEGTYTVDLYADGKRIGSKSFYVK